MPPEVTVVIPSYNGARRLPLLLQALTAQYAPDGSFEVVVVDNNSTDDTSEHQRSTDSMLKRRSLPIRNAGISRCLNIR
jgi:glycosyltransferase involved in cell wall biosynthesis